MRIRLYISLRGLRRIRRFTQFLGTSSPYARYAACPECGTERVKRLIRRDRIDRMSDVPWSTIQRHLGGKLFHCVLCRLQFYDCRKQAPSPLAFLPGPVTTPAAKAKAQTQS